MNLNNKVCTKEVFEKIAKEHGFTYEQLKTLTDFYSSSVGFLTSNLPKIQFYHEMFVGEVNQTGLLDIKLSDLESGLDPIDAYAETKVVDKNRINIYNFPSNLYEQDINHEVQHDHMEDALNIAIKLLKDDNEANRIKLRECAYKAASWGIGQIQGTVFQDAGFDSVEAFIDAMYESEEKQLEAFAKCVKANAIPIPEGIYN